MNRPVLDVVGVSGLGGTPRPLDIHLQVRSSTPSSRRSRREVTLLGILPPRAAGRWPVHLDGTDIHHLGSATCHRREYLGLIYQEPQSSTAETFQWRCRP